MTYDYISIKHAVIGINIISVTCTLAMRHVFCLRINDTNGMLNEN